MCFGLTFGGHCCFSFTFGFYGSFVIWCEEDVHDFSVYPMIFVTFGSFLIVCNIADR